MDWAALSTEELVRKCVDNEDAAAWEEFVCRFHRPIARVVLRVARQWRACTPQLIDDLVQEIYLKLCDNNFEQLRDFKPQHPDAFYSFVKVVAANLVHDHFKAAYAAKRGSGAAAAADNLEIMSDADSSATTTAVQIIEKQILFQQIDALLCELAHGPHLERDRRIFWLYYRTGLTANAIAALPSIGLSTKGVESAIKRLTDLVIEAMHNRKAMKRMTEGI